MIFSIVNAAEWGLIISSLSNFSFLFFFSKDEAEFTAASGLGEIYLLISKEKKIIQQLDYIWLLFHFNFISYSLL